MVKITFNEAVLPENNQDHFALEDEDGKAYDFTVLQGEDEESLSLLLNEDLLEAKKYSVIMDKAVTAVSGNTLAQAKKIEFETENPKEKSGITNMALVMIVFVVAGVALMQIKEKKEEEKSNNKKRKKN